MPSPLAHASLVFFAKPLLARQGLHNLPRRRQWAFYVLVIFALCAADLDFVFLLLPEHPMHEHGTYTHSLVAAILFAPLFGLVAWWLLQQRIAFWLLTLLGLFAYGSHLLMDMLTLGRGIMLLWPITTERYAIPIPTFIGAEHSNPWAWQRHLLTFITEIAFAMLIFLTANHLTRKHRLTPSNARSEHRNKRDLPIRHKHTAPFRATFNHPAQQSHASNDQSS